MKAPIKALLTGLLLVAVSLLAWNQSYSDSQDGPVRELLTYQTTLTRMNLNKGLCAGVDRASIFSQDEIAENKNYVAQLKSAVPIDGNVTFNKFFDDTSQGPTILMSNMNGLIMFVGPFALGLVLICICCPVFQCCCCCPDCCPPVCCRKADDELYTKCELYWPTIVLLLALCLAAAGSAFGFTKASSFSRGITNVACSISMIPDDLLNGNVTDDGKNYFSGLNMLNTNLNALVGAGGALTTLNTALATFQSTSATMSATVTALNTLLTNIVNSDGYGGVGVTLITYGSNVGSQTGLLPGILGRSTTTGKIKTYYDQIMQLKTQITTMSAKADAFVANSANLAPAVTSVTGIITPILSSISGVDQQFGSFLDLSGFTNYATMGVQMYYAAVMGLAALAMLGAILMAFCERYKCRYLMYFACCFMLLVAGLGFFLSTIFSVILPITSWTCEYLQVALTDAASFNYNFRGIDASVKGYLGPCMPFGNGDILSTFGMAALTPLTDLTSMFSDFNSFDVTTINSQVSSGANDLLTTVTDIIDGVKPDIANTAYLNTIANPANDAACAAAAPNFLLDSYVPSNAQNPVYAACTRPGNNANEVVCSNNGGANFNPRGSTCFGCLDVSRIFKGITTTTFPGAGVQFTTVYNAVMARYGNVAGCNTFANAMGNLWAAYHMPRQQYYAPTQTACAATVAQATTVTTSLTNLKSALTTANSSLTSIAYLTDPTYGMLGGLNCRVFGEDIQRLVNSLCVSTFNSMYVIRLGMGMGSIGILISIFCIVCTGPRHYRQGEKKSKVQDSYEQPKSGHEKREQITVEAFNKNDTS